MIIENLSSKVLEKSPVRIICSFHFPDTNAKMLYILLTTFSPSRWNVVNEILRLEQDVFVLPIRMSYISSYCPS